MKHYQQSAFDGDKRAMKQVLTCPQVFEGKKCDKALEHFNGTDANPEYWYCPIHHNIAYNYAGEEIGAIK